MTPTLASFEIVRYVRPALWTFIDTFSGAFIEINRSIFQEVKNTCDLCQIFVSLTCGYPALTMAIIILISRKLYDISSVSCHDFTKSPFNKWNPKMLHREVFMGLPHFLWGCFQSISLCLIYFTLPFIFYQLFCLYTVQESLFENSYAVFLGVLLQI